MLDTYPYHLAGADADAPVNATQAELDTARALLDSVFGAAPVAQLAPCLVQLRAEANAANPARDKSSDGWIGDAAHAARDSQHNPDAYGFVTAVDLDVDGLDLAAVFERIRAAVYAGLMPWMVGGYLILNGRITTADWSGWKVYTGSNPHRTHGHASSSRDRARYMLRQVWGVFTGSPAPTPQPAPAPVSRTLALGSTGPAVGALQRALRTRYPAYRHSVTVQRGQLLTVDDDFGPQTDAWVREYQHRAGLDVDGRAGKATLTSLGLW